MTKKGLHSPYSLCLFYPIAQITSLTQKHDALFMIYALILDKPLMHVFRRHCKRVRELKAVQKLHRFKRMFRMSGSSNSFLHFWKSSLFDICKFLWNDRKEIWPWTMTKTTVWHRENSGHHRHHIMTVWLPLHRAVVVQTEHYWAGSSRVCICGLNIS